MPDFFKKINLWPGNRRGKNRIVRMVAPAGANKKVIGAKKDRSSGGMDKSFWLRVLVWLLTAGFAAVVIYVLFFSPLLKVKSVIVDGLESLDSRKIISTSNDAMNKEFLGLLDKSNLILVDSAEIKRTLLDKYKKIEEIGITRKFPDKLLITIKERGATMIFCGGAGCYVIDRQGRAFAPADFQSNELDEGNLTVLKDANQKNIPMEDIQIDHDLMRFMADIEDRMAGDMNLALKQEWSTPTLVSGDLRAETTDGWRIYFNNNISVDKEMEMLKTSLDNSIDKSRLADLEYIDLRLDNKVYYKFKSAPVAEDEAQVQDSPPPVEDSKQKKKKR